jgi:phage-related protein (TIGR01555 family)
MFGFFRKRVPDPETGKVAPVKTGIDLTDEIGDLTEAVRMPLPGFADYLNHLAAIAPTPVLDKGTMDDDDLTGDIDFKMAFRLRDSGSVNEALSLWYARQGFIGHQLCAILAQQWLIDKACSMPAEDALRHGYKIVTADGERLPPEALKILKRADKTYGVKQTLFQYMRMGRIFGLAIAVFRVESDDPKYYEHPFNPDAVTPGSYKGVSIVEPYWCVPQLELAATTDPANACFYEPTWWKIGGRLYHRSHLVIFRQDDVADILKPAYFYGGIPIPQKILERVYAAERTANEAPALAMNKRTTVYLTSIENAFANMRDFSRKIMAWVRFRDNHSVKIADKSTEDIKQFDTTLTDFDTVMMSQYQLVAAAAKVPATKLLGTTPKGFNATGEYEEASYHETLESIQEHYATPFLERHHQLVMLSEVKAEHGEIETTVTWNPVDSYTAKERAEIRKLEAETDLMLVEAGVLEAIELREKLQNDENSGFDNLKDVAAEDYGAMREQLEALSAALGETEPVPAPEAVKELTDADPQFKEAMTEAREVARVKPIEASDWEGVRKSLITLRRVAGMEETEEPEEVKEVKMDAPIDLSAPYSLKTSVRALREVAGMDEEEMDMKLGRERWITVNGARVKVGKDGTLMNKVGKKIQEESQKRKPLRKASNFRQAREAASKFVGKPLTNTETGMVATVSRNNLDKMLSESAVKKSVSPAVHSMAVANADTLYQNARHGERQEDRNSDTNIVAIHRFYAPMEYDENKYSVKLTVKELAQSGNSIYTVEAVDVETPLRA